MVKPNDAIRTQLASTSGERRASLVRNLVAQAVREQASSKLVALSEALEELSDWENLVRTVVGALQLELSDAERAEWTTRLAWYRFISDDPDLAWDTLAQGRRNIESNGAPNVRSRAYLVSGYVMDVRGLHAAAHAWYAKALTIADTYGRPHVLLEIATSQSKQGHLVQALATFDDAKSLLAPDDAKHERLRVHILSRSAVVLELLGDVDEAIRRQTLAFEVAKSAGSPGLEFECLRRRARSLIAKGQFVDAQRDLDQAGALAAEHRRGLLHLTHDLARLERAKGNWQVAASRYTECLQMLPDSTSVIRAYSDLWSEILDGLDACFARTHDCSLALVHQAQTDSNAVRNQSDIYSGQAVRLEELRTRAVQSTEALRRILVNADKTSFVSAGYRFDIAVGEAHRISTPDATIPLDAGVAQVIRFLWNRPQRRATAREIHAHLRKTGGAIEESALRKRISRWREVLGIRNDQVLVGQGGGRDGGYRLVIDS